jgi:hypothetical protein
VRAHAVRQRKRRVDPSRGRGTRGARRSARR